MFEDGFYGFDWGDWSGSEVYYGSPGDWQSPYSEGSGSWGGDTYFDDFANGQWTTTWTDSDNNAEWSQVTERYDASGNYIGETGVADNGDTWTTSFVNGGWQEVWNDTNDSSGWSSVTENYDANGNFLSESGVTDEGDTWTGSNVGALWVENWNDVDDSSPWTSLTESYDQNGNLVSQSGVSDDGDTWTGSFIDGTWAENKLDNNNDGDWSQVTTFYDNEGNALREFGTLDDGDAFETVAANGGYVSTYTDSNNNNDWWQVTETYDANGDRVAERDVFHDGDTLDLIKQNGIWTGVETDVNNDSNWSRVEYSNWNDEAQKWASETFFDDNGDWQKSVYNDVSNTEPYSTRTDTATGDDAYTRNYALDDGNQLDQIYMSDKLVSQTELDTNNDQAWSSITQNNPTADGTQWQTTTTVNDDGSRSLQVADTQGSQDWNSYIQNWDAAGQLLDRVVQNDNGTVSTETIQGDASVGASARAEYTNNSGENLGDVTTASDGQQTATLTGVGVAAGAHIVLNPNGTLGISLGSTSGVELPGNYSWTGFGSYLFGLAGSTAAFYFGGTTDAGPDATTMNITDDLRFTNNSAEQFVRNIEYRDANGNWQSVNGLDVNARYVDNTLYLDHAQFQQQTGQSLTNVANDNWREQGGVPPVGDNGGPSMGVDEPPNPPSEPPNDPNLNTALVAALAPMIANYGSFSPDTAQKFADAVADLYGGARPPDSELARLLDLGYDPEASKFRVNEMVAARNFETSQQSTLSRSTGAGEDYKIDTGPLAGHSIDFTGAAPPSLFDQQFDSMTIAIRDKLQSGAADYVGVDVSQFDATQINRLQSFKEGLSPSQQSKLIFFGK